MALAPRCIFVFFMIFNAILGLSGIILLVVGIIAALKSTGLAFIANIAIGVYIITILILGACSWKKVGVLIAYFVLIILLMLAEIGIIVLFKVGTDAASISISIDIFLIVFGISLGISFLSFLFSTIYFCLMRKDDDPQLYINVKNMEYTNMPQYQNV